MACERFAVAGKNMDIEFNLTTETVEQASPVEAICVEPQMTVREVLLRLREQKRGGILVCRDGVLVGIFTERDALRIMASIGNPAAGTDSSSSIWQLALDMPIEKVMVRNPVSVTPQTTVAESIQKMSAGRYRRVPIVDEQGRPDGVVQASGIVHYLVQHFPKTIYNQPPVAHPVMQQREGP